MCSYNNIWQTNLWLTVPSLNHLSKAYVPRERLYDLTTCLFDVGFQCAMLFSHYCKLSHSRVWIRVTEWVTCASCNRRSLAFRLEVAASVNVWTLLMLISAICINLPILSFLTYTTLSCGSYHFTTSNSQSLLHFHPISTTAPININLK